MNKTIKVIIPAYNEENAIVKVIQDIPSIVDEIIVVDNNSSDQTAKNAREAGAKVLTELKRGYGYACLKGMDYIKTLSEKPAIIVFLDGDFSDYPEELTKLTLAIRSFVTELPLESSTINFTNKPSPLKKS